MNEPIVVARVRKAVKLELKAGDWVILSSPDGTFSDANKAFDKVNSPVNEDYNRIIIGKIQHSRAAQNPMSAEQNKQRLAQVSEQSQKVEAIVAQSIENTKALEEKRTKDAAEQLRREKEAKAKMVEQIRKSTNYKAS
ncbi:MAG: hypothetical protein KGL39_21670 [Patescibacteria group bacterium]|nr:hypothetical protein [Patescibacteria group bacterium]